MMKRLVYSICVLAFLSTPVQSKTAHGLTLKGRVISVRHVRELSQNVDVKIGLRLQFVNTESEPIVMIRPWKDDSFFWHGGSCLAKTADDASSGRCYFSDGIWESTSRDESYRKLADDLDQSAPPQSLTKILKPGESWDWDTEIGLRFEDDPRSYKVPWNEMSKLPSPLWLRVSFEIWPFNVEVFKPNLASTLQKRWRRYGNMWIGERIHGRMHLARLASEPIQLDWSAVVVNDLRIR